MTTTTPLLISTATIWATLDPFSGWCVLFGVMGLIALVTNLRLPKLQKAEKPAPDYVKMMSQAVDRISNMKKDLSEGDNHVLLFLYQDANFLLTHGKEDNYHLCMPHIMVGSLSNLNVIRAAINEINQEGHNEHMFYVPEHEDSKIPVFIKVNLSGLTTDEELADSITASISHMFELRENFYRKELAWELMGKHTGSDDLERSMMEKAFEHSAISQQEARHLMPRPERTADYRHPMRLGTLLLRLCDAGLPPFRRLQVVTDEDVRNYTNVKEIQNFDALSPIVERDAEGMARVKARHATLIVRCNTEGGRNTPDELLTLTLQLENQTEAAIYVRATICRTPVPGSGMETVSDDHIYMDNLSLILAATILPEDKRITEVDYMWHEALDAKERGDYDNMTEEEKYMLFYTLDRDVYESIYWGRKRMLEHRYYEALLYLECAYEVLAPQFNGFKREARERFHELCYQIGFCYCELQLYKEAYVYLEAVAGKGNPVYTMEYVNCLVNSKDHRALGVVNTLIGQTEQYRNDTEGEPSDNMQEFYDFLRRRKAYLLIDTDRLDDAEQLLKSMLGEPTNSDFALDELAYIQNLRRDKADETEDKA